MSTPSTEPSPIVRHSFDAATASAARLWALASAEYSERHQALLDAVRLAIVDEVSVFAVNARRTIEFLGNPRVRLEARRWIWESTVGTEEVLELKKALDRVLHARELTVAFVRFPQDISVIDGGGVVVPFLKIKTDRRPPATVDLFALAHAYLYDVFPRFVRPGDSAPATTTPTAG